MTRKIFILAGLFLITLGAFSIALQTFLVLSEIILAETDVYFSLFRLVVIPLAFGLLAWKRIIHIGKSRRFTACCIAGIIAAYFLSMILLPLMAIYLDTIYFDNSALGDLMNEIAIWSKSGGEGDFTFSTYGKLKIAAQHAFILALASWPLFAALYFDFGAGGPWSPRGNKPLARISKRAVEKDNSALNLRKQMVS